MGRRKIEIKMVKDTNTRQVTFSKRRTGLFKKANELSILCGAEVAIVVFSPGNKPYSFGHPGVDAVAAKYLIDPDEEADPDADADAVVVAAAADADGDGDGGDHDDEEGGGCGGGSASSGDDESDDHVADDDHVERLNKMLAEVMEQVREAEKEAAACDEELGLRMALTGRDEFQGLRDAHVGLKGLVKERLGLLEAVEALLLLAEKPVVGIPKKRRRTN